MRSIAILGCNIYSQITVAHVTLPKAVLNTVKIFAVYHICFNKNLCMNHLFLASQAQAANLRCCRNPNSFVLVAAP